MARVLIEVDGERREEDEANLVKKEYTTEDDMASYDVIEYWLSDVDVPVHRSVHATLKRWPDGMTGAVQDLTKI